MNEEVNKKVPIVPNQWYCKYCERSYKKSDEARHVLTKKHWWARKMEKEIKKMNKRFEELDVEDSDVEDSDVED